MGLDKRNRIIITGSEGVVGSALSSHLEKSHEVIRLSRRFGHDLTDEGFVKEWFSKNQAEYLVNCFGMSDAVDDSEERSTLFDASLESLREFLQVNVVALFSVCREFARSETARGIVNFSSTYGLVSPLPSLYDRGEKHIGYSASKGAVVQLTRHLAVHLAPRIRVNCVVPGGIEHEQGADFIERYSAHVPMCRMMKKDELNGLMEYLCSDASSYMTGAVIPVDGGWTTW